MLRRLGLGWGRKREGAPVFKALWFESADEVCSSFQGLSASGLGFRVAEGFVEICTYIVEYKVTSTVRLTRVQRNLHPRHTTQHKNQALNAEAGWRLREDPN